MNNEIAIAPEQVEELLTLTYNFGTVTDIITARNIYKESIKQAGGVCSEWEFSCALGNILRIGYIMGQRAERRRTHTPRRANLWRLCRSYIREGAAA